jgi:hypothetical protein
MQYTHKRPYNPITAIQKQPITNITRAHLRSTTQLSGRNPAKFSEISNPTANHPSFLATNLAEACVLC